MLTKKKEDRNKSSQSNSPYGIKSKEGTSGAISSDGKQARMNIWSEWSETEVNNEKWEVLTKTKEKDKMKSPQMTQNLFDDPDGKLRLPPSLKVAKWKRSHEYFTKNPVIVDTETGVHKFDIFSLNEHLFISETMRWIICQINILWITSEKRFSLESDNQNQDSSLISSDGTYHSWKFWEHIYALNKVGKGFPQYNSAGKYIVKLFWMGEWRKILIDDTLPFDENDQLLLPITSLRNELWPIILSKALLKIASLSYGFLSNDTEFGDFSVIYSLTGWIPQKKVISKEYKNQIWDDLQNLLPRWTYPDSNLNVTTLDKTNNFNTADIQYVDVGPEKAEIKEANIKDKKKDLKDLKPKEKKEREKFKPDKLPEEKYMNDNPETLVLAAYTSMYNKLNMLTASKMANHSESLRKLGISQIYSHPVLISYYRDCDLTKPKSPEAIPSWKLIRPLIRSEIPKADDCLEHNIPNQSHNNAHHINNDIKFVQIQSHFLNYKVTKSRYSSFSQSSVENIEENFEEEIDLIANNSTLISKSIKEGKEILKDSEVSKLSSVLNRNAVNLKTKKLQGDNTNEEETSKVNVNDKCHKVDFSSELPKCWIDIDSFYDCFQVVYVYHKTGTYRYSESFGDMKSMNTDHKEPLYLFTDNTDVTEIIFCLSAFCKWFVVNDNSCFSDNQTNRNSPLIAVTKDVQSSFETINPESDFDTCGADSLRGLFIAECHSWKYFTVGKCTKRIRTNGTKAFSLSFPPGRSCLRIFIQSPNGFHCKLISQNQFYFGNEDKIMPLSVEEPKRIIALGLNLISLFNNVITNFSKEEERNHYEQLLINLVSGCNSKTINFKTSNSKFMEVFNQCLLKNLNKISKDIITSDMIFAFRAVNLDFNYPDIVISKLNNNSNRNSAKAPLITSKVENRKQSSTKSVVNTEAKEDKKMEFAKEYSPSDLKYITQLQKLIRGFYVRKVINSRNSLSINHTRVVNELNKISILIEQNSYEIGTSVLNEIISYFPQLLKYYDFENDKLNHICLKEYSGNSNLQSGNGFGILFRDIFYVNSSNKIPSKILIKLSAGVQKCLLSVINNDDGKIYSENVFKRLFLSNIRPNNKGYTLIAIVKDAEKIIDWKLRLIGDGNTILPKFNKPELCNEFSISKIRDYFIPDESGILFQQMIKVKNDHPVTIFIKVSNPDVPIRLSIFNHDEVYFTDGIGEACISSFNFFKDQNIDDQSPEVLSRTASRAYNKPKKIKDKIDRYSSKISRTNSSCSTEENKINKYSIQAFINIDMWPLSESNQEFLENLKKLRKKDMSLSENKICSETTNKIVQHSEITKKEATQKTQSKIKGKDKSQEISKNIKNIDKSVPKNISNENFISRPNSNHFDSEKANFTAFIVSDASLEDNIQIYRNREQIENLCAVKKIWLEMDPFRFEKGKQIQMKYNKENKDNQGNTTDEIRSTQVNINKLITKSLNGLNLSMFYPENTTLASKYLANHEKRCQTIDLYRQQQLEWNIWCQSEKLHRIKKVNKVLNVQFNRQEIVDLHRLNYFKARENLKQVNHISQNNIETK